MMAHSWVMRCFYYGLLQSIHLYIFWGGIRPEGSEGVTAGGLPGYGGVCVRGCGRCGGHEKRPRRWVPVSAGVFFQSGKGMG